MSRNLTNLVTADDLIGMQDDGICRELVRGELREMPPPGAQHGAVTGYVHGEVHLFVRQKKLGRVFAAETGFLIERDPDTVRAPDCAFVRANRLPDPLPAKYLPFAPDLAVETVSPDDRPEAVGEKVDQWLSSGTRLVWVIDPGRRRVLVHAPGREARTLQEGDFLDGEDVLPGLRIAISDLWT